MGGLCFKGIETGLFRVPYGKENANNPSDMARSPDTCGVPQSQNFWRFRVQRRVSSQVASTLHIDHCLPHLTALASGPAIPFGSPPGRGPSLLHTEAHQLGLQRLQIHHHYLAGFVESGHQYDPDLLSVVPCPRRQSVASRQEGREGPPYLPPTSFHTGVGFPR